VGQNWLTSQNHRMDSTRCRCRVVVGMRASASWCAARPVGASPFTTYLSRSLSANSSILGDEAKLTTLFLDDDDRHAESRSFLRLWSAWRFGDYRPQFWRCPLRHTAALLPWGTVLPMKTARGQRIHVERYLASAGRPRMVAASEVIFSQGDDADGLMYLLAGVVTLSVSGRRKAIVGTLGSGNCFGEECLAGHAIRKRTATAITPSTVLVIGKVAMLDLLHTEPAVADHFIAHMVSRKVRIEDDLIDQLQSSCEQRLARTLLTLTGLGHGGTRRNIVPRMSQTTLAGIVGSTRSRINSLLQKFKTRGLIEMDGSLIVVRRSLRSIVAGRARR
jgi:CRP/FNR family cyclic AMP-dependent transcriptional regulator